MKPKSMLAVLGAIASFNAPPPRKPKGYKPGGWLKVKALDDGAVEMLIYDEIGKDWWTGEGLEAKAFADELKKIPKDRELKIRINSGGGNVHDGMAIYNLLAERREKVTVIVDGVAASIASVIALAGRELVMPRNTLLMIHDPWGFAQGSADDMRQAATTLDAHRDAMVAVYERKTGASQDDIKKLMKEETWFTGEQAHEAKFADTISNEISLKASASLLKYQKVPADLAKLLKPKASSAASDPVASSSASEDEVEDEHSADSMEPMHEAASESSEDLETRTETKSKKTSAASGGQRRKEKIMNKTQIIALLKKAGIKVADSATDEELLAAMNKLAERTENASEAEALDAAERKNILEKIKGFDDQAKLQRRERIEASVKQCVDEDRIPGAQAKKWVDRAIADETVLDDLRAMPPRPPGADPISITLLSESPKDVENGLMALKRPMASFMRGNRVEPVAIRDSAIATAKMIQMHRKQLDVVLAANTIDTALKRTVIMNDIMRAFKRRLLNLSVFSTRYENIPLEGTRKMAVPFYNLDTTASTDYVAATGYTFASDTDVGVREVDISNRKFQSMNFTSDTFRRQPYFRPEVHLMLKAEQLAVDVWTAIMGVITAANYGASVFNAEAGTFDSDDMSTLRGIAETNDWPTIGRAAVLSTDHEVALGQDDYVKSALHSGSDQTLREGSTGRLYGFDMYFSPRIPTNSEDLNGFITMPQSVIVGTAPILPAPGVRQTLLSYEVVIDPDTGIAFEYRYGSDVWLDTDREVIECNFGFAKGNASALKRITAGSAEYSSSSSASSVNSSSSSSSSASY